MRFLDEHHEEALVLYKQGLNDTRIAEELFIGRRCVYEWRKRNGLERNMAARRCQSKKTPEKIEKIRKLKTLGKTDREIGRLLGIGWSTVTAYRKQEGIQA